MRTADEILKECGIETMDNYNPVFEKVKTALNKARCEALTEAMNVVKTYKVGNSGSWYDAAVDREPIIELLKQVK